MPKELLSELVARHLFLPLFLLGLIHISAWYINLKLNFQILGKRIGLSKIWYGILVGSLFTLTGKSFLPNIATYGLLTLVLTVVLSKTISKSSWLKSFWSTVLVILITFISGLVSTEPLCSASKEIAFFIVRTPMGAVLGSLIEMLFPALALFILTTFHISLPIPSGKRLTLIEFFSVLAFVILIFILYNAFGQTLMDLKDTGKLALTQNTATQWAGAILVGILLYIILALFQHDQLVRKEEHDEMMNEISNVISTHMDTGYSVRRSEGGILIETYITTQELKIIALVVQEKTNQEIADIMNLAEGTIRNTISDILGKLGLSSREQLAKYAIKKDLLTRNDKTAS